MKSSKGNPQRMNNSRELQSVSEFTRLWELFTYPGSEWSDHIEHLECSGETSGQAQITVRNRVAYLLLTQHHHHQQRKCKTKSQKATI